eukprot:SAG31_NODE_2874_length_4971_cov_9.677750_5_plen_48_part_00
MMELRLEVPHDAPTALGIETAYDYTLQIHPESSTAVAAASTIYGACG